MINNGHNIEKTNFDAFINAVGSEIQQAQVRLITAANAQMLFHYWKMGNYILYHQQLHGWGSKTIKQLAKAIRLNFPEKKGYSELLYVKPLDDGLVEIADKCCKKKEHGVLCHEGFGQSGPSETIVHVIEDALLSSAEVIELDNLSYGRLVVVGQDAAVCVFSFPEVKLTVCTSLSLNDKTIALSFPFLNENGIEFILCFKELMVEINIIGFHLIQFTGRNQGFYNQGVELVCCIEIVSLALIRSIGDVILFSSLMALRMVSELQVRSIG